MDRETDPADWHILSTVEHSTGTLKTGRYDTPKASTPLAGKMHGVERYAKDGKREITTAHNKSGRRICSRGA
jgi:hypothetical protein